MHIEPHRHFEAFRRIVNEALALPNHCTVFVFVATDVDGLAASRIILELLKTESIAHKVIPVTGYDDLSRENEKLISTNENLRSVILVNCGANVSVMEHLSLDDHVTAYVIDSHRPVSLDNLVDADQVWILDDGEVDELGDEIRAFIEESQESSSDEEFDEHSDSDTDGDPDSLYEENLDPNRLSKRERYQLKIEKRRNNQRILGDYYDLSWYGQPSSVTAYQMANQLGKANNDTLWCAILGVTEQYIYDRLDEEQYDFFISILREEVRKYNISHPKTAWPETTSTSADDDTIHYKEKEFKFMLFRHWSLYESLYYSSYVGSKLGIWRERGRQRLQNLMAQMGFSHAEANQPYLDMSIELRRDIYDRLEDKAVALGLEELTFKSYQRNFGYKCSLTASDAIYSLTALLEIPFDQALQLGVDLGLSGFSLQERWLWTSKSDEVIGGRSGFYLALDALSNVNILRQGVMLAQNVQREIVATGMAIIEERKAKTLRNFRMCVLKDNELGGVDLRLFSHPLTLTKLALFLVEAMKETRRAWLPFVMACHLKDSDMCLVVGIEGMKPKEDSISIKKNKFGQAFTKTADVTRADIKQQRFDSSVIELPKRDLVKFMEHLQMYMQ